MNIKKFLIFLYFLIISINCFLDQNKNIYSDLYKILSDVNHPLAACSVGIIKNGKIIFYDTVGYKQINNEDSSQNIKANYKTKFRIASISKLFTTIAIFQLVEKGLVDLDTDISDYLGFEIRNPNFPNIPITIKMLLSHTSSIREKGGNDTSIYRIPYPHPISEFFTEGAEYEFKDRWSDISQSPNEYFSYCNMGFCLIGTIIERITGIRFDHYMKQNILKPLGFDAGFNVVEMSVDAKNNIATLYRKLNDKGEYDPNGKWIPQHDDYSKGFPTEDYPEYEIGSNGSLFGPMGSLRISIEELTIFMQMLINNGTYNNIQILKKETIDKMFSSVWKYDPILKNGDTENGYLLNYGFGPQIFTNTKNGDKLVDFQNLPFSGHSADAHGLLGILSFDRYKQNGIVIIAEGISNSSYKGEYSAATGWEENLMTVAAKFAEFDY